MIKLYDRFKLKTGETGYIVEILEDGVAYIADVDYADGTDTVTIWQKDIAGILRNDTGIKKAI